MVAFQKLASQLRFLPLLAALLLGACGERVDIEVKARLDGQPAAGAKVVVEREELGVTDDQGNLVKQISRKAGTELELTVTKDAPGYRIEPWKTTFMVKLPKDGQAAKYRFDADLKAMRFVTLRVNDKGAPLSGAKVSVGGKDAGATDDKGELVYLYRQSPPKGVELGVAKAGYGAYRATRRFEPGEVVEVALNRQAVLTIKALTDEYGRASGLQGLSVSVDGKPLGKTDAQGALTYTYRGEPGKKAVVALAAPGYIPPAWKTSVQLDGPVGVQHYFYPTTPKPIRIGIYRVVGNTPGADLSGVAAQTEQSLAAQLFKFPAFREVPSEKLQAEIKQRKLAVERIAAKGWQDTPLRGTVDMIVLGSVAQDGDGYLVEVKFHTASGKIIFSEIARARSARAVDGAVRDIANNVIERFPLEGTVVAVEDERYRVNIGRSWRISRGTEFTLTAPTLGEGGKVTGYRETGRMEVRRSEDTSSLVDVATLRKGEKVQVGDRVVRRTGSEGGDTEQRSYVLLTAKGGVGADVNALPGTNVYLNGEWKGATGANGQAEIPLRPGKSYSLLLYRHGYQQVAGKLSVEKSGEAREFVLAANNALFRVDSDPSPAAVYVDDEQVGKTPLSAGKQVTLGFHSVRLSYGEDYRDFFEVMEFAKKEEDRKVVLQKDFLKIGERAREKGDLDGAIKAYGAAGREHPDYAEARRRLGNLYLDEKEDYDRAIDEFETVLSLPENEQLIYKQFAVTFTNLGHAYTERGNRLVNSDRDAASQSFAKAIKALQTAKQNTRFFPKDEYDEAVHDTYYYTALAYHKLYLITRQPAVMNSASLAWREYFDFFPKKLEDDPNFQQAREAARRYRDQIQEQ
jgi:tetratricopeptide (TPR) repeat protein